MKIHITFFQVPYPRSEAEEKELHRKYFWLKFLKFIQIDDVVLKLNAFAVENAVESQVTLSSRLLSKLLNDLQFQLVQLLGQVLLGSIDFLGKPGINNT